MKVGDGGVSEEIECRRRSVEGKRSRRWMPLGLGSQKQGHRASSTVDQAGLA